MTPAPRENDSPACNSARFCQRVKARLSNPARLFLMLALAVIAGVFVGEGAEWLFSDRRQPIILIPASPAARAILPNEPACEGRISINEATVQDLLRVHGIGPALAQAIIDTREEMNGFLYWEEITDVPGIGQKRLDALSAYFYCPQPIDP